MVRRFWSMVLVKIDKISFCIDSRRHVIMVTFANFVLYASVQISVAKLAKHSAPYSICDHGNLP